MLSSRIREMTQLLQELQRALHQSAWRKTKADVQELTLQQVRALHVVFEKADLPMGELARALRVTKASANVLVNRLCRKGWLVRTRDKNDRRMMRLSLAPRAEKRIDAAVLQKQSCLEQALAHLSSSEQEQLFRLLTKLSSILHS